MQVESLAQLGVQLLLFHLGRDLSFKKLRSVWSVALLGGSLQIAALMVLGGLVAAAVKSNVTQGIFVGALLSMSSTSVVVKCLQAYHMTASAYGQITIGTLILQVSAVVRSWCVGTFWSTSLLEVWLAHWSGLGLWCSQVSCR